MIHALQKRRLDATRASGKRRIVLIVYNERQHAGEIADDLVDVRVQRKSLQECHIEQESRVARPAADDFGVSGQDCHGRRDVERARSTSQLRPLLRIQFGLPAAELRCAACG